MMGLLSRLPCRFLVAFTEVVPTSGESRQDLPATPGRMVQKYIEKEMKGRDVIYAVSSLMKSI